MAVNMSHKHDRSMLISLAHLIPIFLSSRGFVISTVSLFIGASPDVLVSCLCCGKGICECKVRKHPL